MTTTPKHPRSRGTYATLARPSSTPTASAPPPAGDLADLVAAVRATRPVRTRSTPRYGRKAQPGMVQLGVVIPEALKTQLAAFAQAHDLQLAEAAQVILRIGLEAKQDG